MLYCGKGDRKKALGVFHSLHTFQKKIKILGMASWPIDELVVISSGVELT